MRGLLMVGFIIALLPTIVVQPYVGVLLYSWVSFMNPQRVVYGFAVDMPWAMIIAAMTLVVWACSRESKRPPADASYWLIVAFLAWISVTTVFALSNSPRVFEKWELTSKILLFVLVTMTMTTNRVRVQALVWVMAISVGFYGLKGGIFTLVTGGGGRVWGPASSIIADNNQFAVALLVAAPLMNYLRLTSSRRIVRIGILVTMMACLIAALGSYSRGALLALGAAGFFLWFKSERKLLPMLALVAVGIVALAVMPAKWGERMDSIEHYRKDSSAMDRLEIWGAALKIAEARPLTGGGFMATYTPQVVERYAPGVEARATHSIYFEVLAEHGFIGLLIWLAIAAVAWRNSRRIIRAAMHRPDLAWATQFGRMAQASLVAYFVGGAFLSMSYWDYYFTLVALLAATRVMVQKAAVVEPASSRLPRTLQPIGVSLPAVQPVGIRPAISRATAPRSSS